MIYSNQIRKSLQLKHKRKRALDLSMLLNNHLINNTNHTDLDIQINFPQIQIDQDLFNQ